ncbi:hypothetical protein KGM_216062 [Danaus plexippus plexippus]|uniref:Uncharacterized protein n=1 Tax=Danaus plexippus plexippus TaxID=278856 RepID=A0A212EHE6_DANPL|nr:uncharacterized protein LOC116771275 [Danaus plexippus plexippus]XP_032518979.1 uncharacterized protein LOC116771275 [Danaus plexippus plexippus]OWR40905.1 hypothetical protein KGM_216062 [Danaus plexippus plexippus]
MALAKLAFVFLTALIAVNLIFAEEEEFPQFEGQRFARSAEESEDSQGRFLNRFTSCNYTATPGSTCRGCFTAVRCLPSNVGIVRSCRGFLPYCNNGRCSFSAAANCSSSG